MPSDDIERDTIAAVATAPGKAGIGVVRLSGAQVSRIAHSVVGRLPAPRHATLASFRDAGGEEIDRGIALYFPAPQSYTGEPVLELQGHGGPVVMQQVLRACLDAGARLAEPGEFTRRAYLEGKLDLAQAEAVADLVDAASREAARSALRSLNGEFSAAVEVLRSQLVELRALTEAMLDFPEEDLDRLHRDDAAARLAKLAGALDDVVSKSRQGSLLRTGIHVVLAGAPNVGKSSLLNRLAGQERAIVTPVPGTTRDSLHEAVQLDGVPLVLVDTAGMRTPSDEVEKLGIDRTRHELARADVVLAVSEAGAASAPVFAGIPADAVHVAVYNKVDLVRGYSPPPGGIAVSAKTGQGLDGLKKAILEAAGWSSTGESAFLARERHLRALERARGHLQTAAKLDHWEFLAEELRLAHEALGSITGEFTADDLLGEIFARFCIGK